MKMTAKYCLYIFTFIATFTFIVFTIYYPKLALFPPKNEESDSTGPSVFFIETNASLRHLSEVSACSVESAAKHHPRSSVIFYKVGTAFDPDSPLLLSLRRNYPNIRFEPLDLTQLFRGTPLQDENGSADEMVEKIWKGWSPLQQMSDVARAALLWKHGGIYLDTDVVVLRPLDAFVNTLGIGSNKLPGQIINNNVMMFEKNSELLYKYLQSLTYLFSPLSYVRFAPGPVLLSFWLSEACGVPFLWSSLPFNAPEKCGGINVIPYHYLSNVDLFDAWKLFSRPEIWPIDFTEAYVLHLNHHMTRGMSTPVGSGSHVDLTFKKNCPVVYEQIRETIFVF